MRQKITITGQRVHEVGYRVFLLRRAKTLRFQKFDAYNASKNGLQILVVMVEGDEKQLSAFKHLVENEEPEGAEVVEQSFEDYDGDVPSIGEFAQVAMLEQLDKGIPALLRMDRKMDQMLDKQDQMLGKQDQMLDKQDQMLDKQDQTISVISSMDKKMDRVLDKQDETVGELRDLREDLARRDNGERLVRMEKDIRVIKSKLSIR
jgi:acylphosphatase